MLLCCYAAMLAYLHTGRTAKWWASERPPFCKSAFRASREFVARIGRLACRGGWRRRTTPSVTLDPPMPFKANADRRHRIPKQRRRITNWAEYDAALRQRGSLTVWFTEAAIAAWHAEPRTTLGGQPHYSSLAIATGLTLKAVFRLALRQTEGLIGSLIRLLGLDLSVPDHTTLSRRAESLEVPRSRSDSDAKPAGGQHGPEALRARGVADREAWHEGAPVLAQAPHRRGCRYGPDRRVGADDQRCR